MNDKEKEPLYQVYILRCWQESGQATPATWRFSLEPVGQSGRRGFADLDQLCNFLKKCYGCENGE